MQNHLPDPLSRENYRWFLAMNTRWMDNDLYGHVNNVTYYSYFDTVANTFLIRECGLDIHDGGQVGYVVHSECSYKSALAFPQHLEGALRVNRIGNSSVQYGIAIFRAGSQTASAHGTFTHVFVGRESEKAAPIEGALREGLTRLLVGAGAAD